MSDITVTAAQVAPVFPEKALIFDLIAAATITAGQAVYRDTAGKAALADADAGSGKQAFAGIALNGAGAGQAVSVLIQGHVYGFTLSGAYGSGAFLSDTAGALADAPSTTNPVRAGQVVALSDANLTKVLYVEAPAATPLTPALRVFVSAEQTGTGGSAAIAHGLGVIPWQVFVAPTDLTPSTTGSYAVTEGTHTSTNVVVTVTNGKKFKVLAFAG